MRSKSDPSLLHRCSLKFARIPAGPAAKGTSEMRRIRVTELERDVGYREIAASQIIVSLPKPVFIQ